MNKKRILKQKVCKHCGRIFSTVTNKNYCSRACANAWRSYFSARNTNNTKSGMTLCWDCAKATAGSDCPWANKFKPVEGWDAKKTERIEMVYGKEKVIESYIVKKCPLFVEG